jgi:type I restriction enzyme S subunit
MKKGWTTKPLGDVATVAAGNSAPQDEALFKAGTIPFFRTADAGRVRFGDILESEDYLNDRGASGLRRFQQGTILFPKSGASTFLNHRVMLGVEGCVSSHLATIVADEAQAHPRFLLYFLSTVQAQDLVQDHAYPSLNLPTIAGIQVHLPPLAEQQRIVGVLDEAFAGLATAQAHAAQNLQNARALFESHLQSVFTHRGKGWVEKTLSELCEVFEDGDWVESKDQSSDGIRLIQTGNVGEGVFKDRAEKARYISEPTFKRLRCTEIFEGDCLISRLPDPVGRSCILPDSGERMITAVDCTIVRFKQAHFLPALFNLYSQSSDYISAVARQCTGTTRNRISRSNLGLIPIPVPPLAEQREIVTQLDALAAETQRLTQLYEQKQAALAALKKSLLHQAFIGEL